MPEIKVLPKQVAELIAAGEVVERPASVIKELVENSIDAKASLVTVEIKNGGVTFMRVTDNGCGIKSDDVATAFLRHATSKVSREQDLNEIMTLGFRGEALAAISSVSRVEMLTKTRDSEVGTHYSAEGGSDITVDDAGCPDGTTIIIRDLFFNTPARMKFLKKDIAEGNAVCAVLDHIALSHPEISFRFIRDGKSVFNTPGDGKLMSAIYAVCGREFAASLIPAEGELGGIKVKGYVCRPSACRPKKNAQFVFLNGRYVRSGTVATALDTAYKNSAMIGRFPAAVLHLTVPYGAVDINVHPAKTEVRFSDEKRIFDCVHFTVKNAIAAGDSRPEMNLAANRQIRMSAEEYRQTVIPETRKEKADPLASYEKLIAEAAKNSRQPVFKSSGAFSGIEFPPKNREDKPTEPSTDPMKKIIYRVDDGSDTTAKSEADVSSALEAPKSVTYESNRAEVPCDTKPSVKAESTAEGRALEGKPVDDGTEEASVEYIGEAFATYIIAKKGESLFLIDKHAAHERILFNRFKSETAIDSQLLLVPEQVKLRAEDYTVILENLDTINSAGFEVEDYGDNTVLVRSIPSALSGENVGDLMFETADGLLNKRTVEIDRLERIFETMACRAAVKAGNLSSRDELKALAEAVLSSREIMYCPHGRPVAIELKRKEIEKQFGRIQ